MVLEERSGAGIRDNGGGMEGVMGELDEMEDLIRDV